MSELEIAITTGEPAGIGPELAACALAQGLVGEDLRDRWSRVHFTLLANEALMIQRASAVGVEWSRLVATHQVSIQDFKLSKTCEAGHLDASHAPYVLALLDTAIDGACAGRFHAIVTAPVQKSILNEAKQNEFEPFTGHTEYLALRTHTPHVVMMLAGICQQSLRPLRVALATTHLPLKNVAAALSTDDLVKTLRIIDTDLRRHFGIASPRILVAGLNPHAGEGGHLGYEEKAIILPALHQVNSEGIDARGPYPADTLFLPRRLDQADCVLAMYHDQGLPVLKYATFGRGFNVTLGLPIIRTSVDHGTALDLAGTGRADAGSFLAAINAAIDMSQRQYIDQARR
jgi:4-hydroxythreonine-4-phosphate dehydrogenase